MEVSVAGGQIGTGRNAIRVLAWLGLCLMRVRERSGFNSEDSRIL